MLPPTYSVHCTSADHSPERVSLQPLTLRLFPEFQVEVYGEGSASGCPLLMSTAPRGSVLSYYSTPGLYSQTIAQVFSKSLNISHSILLACFCGSPSDSRALPQVNLLI